MSSKRKPAVTQQHPKENVSTPEPNENIDEDQQSQQLQQQQQQQSQQHFHTNITGPTTAGTVAALNTMGTNNPNLNAIKESDKLKLMLLAWNYHNQQAQGMRNGAELGDLNSLIQQQQHLQQSLNSEDMANLWANYHAALKGKITPPNVPRDQSPAPGTDAGSIQDETSSSGNKEDDDDDDDESDDRIDTQQYDPDRLKAFNMFVRLFVDENLDRMVPISKQPKEKIQAIIDSCTRQFPEFTERARKRIRTYLKSCRRNKRARDSGSSWDAARPTPAHLTSVQAEQLLASACENESHNAKRMRLGLEPISQPMPILSGNTTTTDTTANMTLKGSMELPSGLTSKQDTNPTTNSESMPSQFTSSANSMSSSISTSKSLQVVQDIKTTSGICSNSSGMTGSGVATSVNALNGFGMSTATSSGSLYRPNFSQAFPRNNTAQYSMFPMQQFPGAGLLNGPTDLSMKHNKPILTHKLNSGEIAAVRQLITGYRESAAFLIRSADELEQLLQQQ